MHITGVYVTAFTYQITFDILQVNTHLFSLPHDAFTTKVTKAFPDPSGCLLHAFGSIQRHHEYYIEAQEEREEARRAPEQVRERKRLRVQEKDG